MTNGNGITREIVAKLWNLCNVLRDDGITYTDYVLKSGVKTTILRQVGPTS